MNTLYYGDNLKILREYVKDESIDLIYLDPPFNSNRNYNVLFKNESGAEAESQITAFEDTWHWNRAAEETFYELINEPDQVGRMIESFRAFIGENQMMAYLVMMAVRLKELHRVLKPTGSLYLHCDPTASHYLKILLDTLFNSSNFRNEIVWRRTTTKGDYRQGAKNYPRIHDVILHYARDASRQDVFNQPFAPYSEDYLKSKYSSTDPDGRRYRLDNLTAPGAGSRGHPQYEFLGVTRFWRYGKEKMQGLFEDGRIVQTKPGAVPAYKRYLDEVPGIAIGDFWDDVNPINSQAQELLGYPTQKPVALLERIISASSNEGDLVLDPFCGCGTTIAAAQKLGRRWIGIDVTHLAVGLMKLRLKDAFGLKAESSKGSTIDQQKAMARKVAAMSEDEFMEMSPWLEGDPNKYFFQVVGQPEDLDGARELAQNDRYGFQWWILPLIGARAFGAEKGSKVGKHGADGGIDGVIVFTDDNSGKAKKVIVSVKSGHPNVSQIRDLAHVIDREKAAIGVYLTLEPPTRPMIEEAVKEGFYHSPGWNKDFPRLQILTVEDILDGKTVDLPPNIETFRQATKNAGPANPNLRLFD